MNWQIRSSWTPSSEYLIDLERGSIYHSRTANHGQKRRLFSTEYVGGDMKHFGIPQAADFIKKIKTAELYLGLLRSQYIFINTGPSQNLVGEFSKLQTHT